MSLVGGGFRIRGVLDSLEQSGCLSHCGDQVCSDTGPDSLAFGGVRKPIQIGHGDSHVGAWRFVDRLVPDHVEGIVEVAWRRLLLLVCTPSGALGVTLFTELPLVVCFSVNGWFVGADIEYNIPSPGGEYRESVETRRV
jgi:hypothetical protein